MEGSNGSKNDASSIAQIVVVEPVVHDLTSLVKIPVQNVSHPSSKDKLLGTVSARVTCKGSAGVIRIDGAIAGSEITPIITAKDMVVAAPTSLLIDKHKAIRVVEDGSKKILHDNNGRAMYRPIRKVYSKRTSRNVNLAAGMPWKNGKLKKSGWY
ncbi:hypothetical protein V6N13_100290 [Hibiscus sabdariffa]